MNKKSNRWRGALIALFLFIVLVPVQVVSKSTLPEAKVLKLIQLSTGWDNKYVEKNLRKMAVIYSKYFTEKELDDLIQFYSSTMYQKLRDAYLEIIQMEISKEMLQRSGIETCVTTMNSVVGAVQTGIALFYANEVVIHGEPGQYPDKLDSAKDGSASSDNLFFTEALDQGTHDNHWSKKGLTYLHTCRGKKRSYIYKPKTGTFR